MQTPNNDEATARRTLVANAAKERRALCLDVLAIEGLDHWEKPLEKAGLLEVRRLVQSENGLAHAGAEEVPPPGPRSAKSQALDAVYAKLKGVDSDGELPSSADEAKAELRSVLGAFGRSLDAYDLIASRLRDGMRTPAAQTPFTCSTVAMGADDAPGRKPRKVVVDVDALYGNAAAARLNRRVPYGDKVLEKTVEDVNKAARHDPPALPDMKAVKFQREGAAPYVLRDKFGKEKKPEALTAADYLGEGAVALDALALGWSFTSDGPDFQHIKWVSADRYATRDNEPVYIGAKLDVVRETYGRVHEACVLGRLDAPECGRAVRRFYRRLDSVLHDTSSSLTTAVGHEKIQDFVSSLSDKADRRAERHRSTERRDKRSRGKWSKSSRRSRSGSDDDSSSDEDSYSDEDSKDESDSDAFVKPRGRRNRKKPARAATKLRDVEPAPVAARTKTCTFWASGKPCPHEKKPNGCVFLHGKA